MIHDHYLSNESTNQLTEYVQNYSIAIQFISFENKIDDIRLVHYSEKMKSWNFDYFEPEKAIYYYEILKEKGGVNNLKELIHSHCKNKTEWLFQMIVEDK